MGFRTDELAGLVLEKTFEVPEEVVGLRGCGFVFDVVGAVVVHAVEVVASLDQGDLFGSERGEAVAELFHHAIGVFAEIDGVREPGDGEFDLAVAGFDVEGILRIPGFGPVALVELVQRSLSL